MKTYLVTGASSGIGKGVVEALLAKGHRCALVARNEGVLQSIVERYPDRAAICAMDLRDVEKISDMFLDMEQNGFLPLDGFIHCAGVAPLMRVDENEVSAVQDAYAVNVFSFLEIMKNIVKENRYNDGMSVVAMSSVAAHRGTNRQSVYSGTKAALEASIRCMAKELLPRGIRVNGIVSGAVETEMLQRLKEQSPGFNERIKTYYPLGSIPITDICEMVEYLLSDAASRITGASMQVDAGYLL